MYSFNNTDFLKINLENTYFLRINFLKLKLNFDYKNNLEISLINYKKAKKFYC